MIRRIILAVLSLTLLGMNMASAFLTDEPVNMIALHAAFAFAWAVLALIHIDAAITLWKERRNGDRT